MAQVIKLKRSNVSGSTPTTASLDLGEVAINTRDGYAWTVRDTDGTGLNNEIVPILTDKTGANAVKDNAKAVLAPLSAGTPVTITGYDNTNEVMEIQAANQATTFANAIVVEDITLDGTGLVIMTGKLEGFDTSTPGWLEGDILYVGNGVLTNVEPTSGYVQPIGYVLRENVTFGAIQVQVSYPKQDADDVRVTATGNISSITVQDALAELDSEKALLAGSTSQSFSTNDLTVAGNLTVSGETTTINTATLDVEDHNIVLGNVTTPSDLTADGGGITLKGATDKTILWNNTKDRWLYNQGIEAPGIHSTSTLSSDGTWIELTKGATTDAEADGAGLVIWGGTPKLLTWTDGSGWWSTENFWIPTGNYTGTIGIGVDDTSVGFSTADSKLVIGEPGTGIGVSNAEGALLKLYANDSVAMTTGGTNVNFLYNVISNATIRGTQLQSTIATGTAPLTVVSTTKVANLNADLLDGASLSTSTALGTSNTLIPSQNAVKAYVDANDYTHPTGDGNLHVPANGITNDGKVLTASAVAGTYTWETPASGGASTINDLTDVTIGVEVGSDDLLQYTGLGWENVPLSSALVNTTLNDIGGVTLSVEATDDLLQYTGTGWENVSFSTAFTNMTLGDIGSVTLGIEATDDLLVYTGTGWENVPMATQLGNAFLGDIGDYTETAAATDDVIYYSGTGWVNTPISTLLGTSAALGDMSDYTETTVTTGDVIKYTGLGWENSTLDFADLGTTPTTLAGYGITDGSTVVDFADLGITPTTLAGYGITDASASTHNHTLDSLSNTTITTNTTGEILKWSGTAWINNTLAEAGISATGHTHNSYLYNAETTAEAGTADNINLRKYIHFNDYDDAIGANTGLRSYVRDGDWFIGADISETNNVSLQLTGTDSFLHAGQLQSDVATGTAPLTVASTTKVTNLNADFLDGVDSTQFLRSDVADIKTAGDLTFNDNIAINLGTGADSELYHTGTGLFLDMNTDYDFKIRDGNSANADRFTFDTSLGDFTATGDVTAYSDISIKENIEIIPDALSKVLTLSGYTFDRIDIPSKRQTGVIAQEVQKVLPEAVIPAEDGKLTVAYGNMVGLLIESIKELEARVKELEGK